MMPSERLAMVEDGFSPVTAYQFDKAVAQLATRIEAQSQETVETQVPAPKPPPKGMTNARKPRYTMRELLFQTSKATMPDDGLVEVDDALRHLPAALI